MSEANPKRTCATCFNYRRFKGADHGFCHKYPPQIMPIGTSIDVVSVWPQVTHNEWCAQWELQSHPKLTDAD
jgi:hypothetical protein